MPTRAYSSKLTFMVLLMSACLTGGAAIARSSPAAPEEKPVVAAAPETANGTPTSVSQLLGTSLADLPQFGANFGNFTLSNGLQVVVIPDHRAPVVTHMIWYKVGGADEKRGQSGIAHFLEHLMFKGTPSHPDGEFSKIVASIGGEENAFTTHDYTAYFQRVAKQHLGLMMELEADRMANLELREDQVLPERKVILEERAMRVDNNPSAQLDEALSAALYRNHPYGVPVIGWEHEMEQLNRQMAIDFYNLYYTPNNAVLVVAGDVTEEEVRALAEKTYGKVERRAEPGERIRAKEPPQLTARSLILRNERVRQPSVRRSYMTPSDTTAQNGEAAALDLLSYILGSGTNCRLYQSLVVKDGIASSTGAYYQSSGLDDTRMLFYGTPAPGHTIDEVLAAIKKEINLVIKDGVTSDEVTRAKRSLLSQAIYAQDNQATLARIVGSNLTSGATLEEIKKWPEQIASVTPEDVVDVARTYLQEHRSVTGYLLPLEDPAEAASTESDPNTAEQPMPKAKTMGKPKDAPRISLKVPNPKSRPVVHPKPKPDPSNEPEAAASPKADEAADASPDVQTEPAE
ncbi:insulinase family protein [uncultured Cohaesibacter sp.]|uniref:insulinase family protein n=1 Tax=uncultured Cohaesibacter sp. TaxID=1002546 RepID=UPI0029C794C1|nr:insulinase family protein [uncultured Cohaesibacter sp.]